VFLALNFVSYPRKPGSDLNIQMHKLAAIFVNEGLERVAVAGVVIGAVNDGIDVLGKPGFWEFAQN